MRHMEPDKEFVDLAKGTAPEHEECILAVELEPELLRRLNCAAQSEGCSAIELIHEAIAESIAGKSSLSVEMIH